jgi:hypothetical protein
MEVDTMRGRRKRECHRKASQKKGRLESVRRLLRDKEVRDLILEIIRTIITAAKR